MDKPITDFTIIDVNKFTKLHTIYVTKYRFYDKTELNICIIKDTKGNLKKYEPDDIYI